MIYISGKITGLDQMEARKMFTEAEMFLKNSHPKEIIINPFHINEDLIPNGTYAEYMKNDIKYLIDCHTACFLPNWKLSAGAQLEHSIAEACGITIKYL